MGYICCCFLLTNTAICNVRSNFGTIWPNGRKITFSSFKILRKKIWYFEDHNLLSSKLLLCLNGYCIQINVQVCIFTYGESSQLWGKSANLSLMQKEQVHDFDIKFLPSVIKCQKTGLTLYTIHVHYLSYDDCNYNSYICTQLRNTIICISLGKLLMKICQLC